MALSRQEKLEYAHAMLRKTAQEVSRNTENWRMFLRSAANVYKYNFTEQLLIYAQKPDAVACAEFDLWSKRMNRYVNRGTRGIILLNDERNSEHLRYVFDVSDTHPARDAKSRMPHQWKVTEDNRSFVISQLAERFDISDTESIEQALHEAAVSVVNESLQDIADELPVYDSFLEGLDKANIEKEIRDTAVSSVEYLLLVKCGLNADENIAPEDFSYICDFNTMDSLCVIGSAVSDVSEQILRTVERAAKKFELQQKQELFNQLSEKGRLVADAKEAKAAAERLNENRSRQREQTTDAQRNFSSRGTQMSLFDEPDKQEPPKDIINQAAVDAALRRGSNFEYGKHRIYDHYQKNTAISETIDFLKKEYGTGGSNYVMEGSEIDESHDAKGIKLTRGENELLISWNTAAVRIGELIQQDRYFTPEEKAFHELYAIREKAAEEFLKTGGYNRDSIMNICIEFSKGNSIYENANFLRNEFKGVNKGLTIDGVDIAFSYSDNFIRYTAGDSTYDRDRVCEFVSWEQAAELVQTMLEEGRFAPQEILDNMHGFELERASHSFWYMAKDLNYDSYPELRDVFDNAWLAGGFPDSTARIARMLDDPAERADLIYTTMVLSERYAEDVTVMRFRMYEPPNVLKQLTDLNLEREQFTAGYYENTAKPFITQDEITAELVGRDEYNQTKTKIYLFFAEHTDNKERADYLKELSGTGGSHNRTGLYISYDKKGVSFARQDAIPVVISWRDMSERIGRLIADNRYMTERQLAEDIPKYQRMQEERQTHNERVQYVDNSAKLPVEERQKDIAKRLYYFIETIDLTDRNKFEQFGLSDMTGSNEEHISEVLTDASKRDVLMSCLERIQMSTTDVYARNNAYRFREELENMLSVQIETENSYLSWYREYSNIKAEFKSEIVFYRVGDFYEMFGDDAVHAAEVLQLTMTGRDNGVERVPMCGIPVHAAEAYISRLVSHGLGVAVADMDGDVHSVARTVMPDSDEITELEKTAEAEHDTDDAEQEEQPEQEQTTDIAAVEDAVITVGMELTIEGRRFEIESIHNSEVSLIDKTFEGSAGFPISRIEPIDRVIQWMQNQPDIQKAAEQAIVWSAPENFRITDEQLGAGGPKTKFKNNIDAIKTLQLIERENRYATPEEQEVMSRYVGWGGLSAAFDKDNSSWGNEYAQLKTLLTEDEYESARASTLSAFYTSPEIIKAMYDALADMGFKKGNVLEPSCAVGNFLGMLPDAMSESKLYGVEIDSIPGRIAKQLYPNADIRIQGFEKADLPDNFFDIVIGNVPFGDFKVFDPKYNKYNFNIHDYFIAKSLDKVRAGGVVSVIVSKGMMDKSNPAVRKYIAQRADLLGAIRLPNTAFKENAGTEVVSDIIFLQKRDRMIEIEPEWVYLGKTKDGLTVNNYFIDHPEMVLGKLEQGINMYGREDVLCVPNPDIPLSEQLAAAVRNINGTISEAAIDTVEENTAVYIPADPRVKNYSYTVVDGDIYFRENSVMKKQELPKMTGDRVKGMIKVRDSLRTLIDMQLEERSDSDIKEQQSELNKLYDDFTERYGLINSLANRRAFNEDVSYYLLSSLEVLDEDGNFERKADMFSKRTIKNRAPVEFVETSSEALAVSVGERACVDIPFMQKLTGFSEEKIIDDLRGVIFPNPMHLDDNGEYVYETADEYLSGNIRDKLRAAQNAAVEDDRFSGNVKALTEVMPVDLKPGEIDVRLGATWINTSYIDQFMYELLGTPRYLQSAITTQYSKYTSEWRISSKTADRNNVKANVTYGTSRVNAYQILENSLNLRDMKIYDTIIDIDGNERRVLNQKETTLAQQKQDAIKQEFKAWIFKDMDRRTFLVNKYNEQFNSIRPREYDGSHLVFNGMTPEINLRNHQLGAIAHTIYGGNTLLAHEVGAGKTFEMVASAMESKRLGLCQKSLFVVPNHLTEQMGADVMRLYPSANILVATKKDFTKDKRRRLCSKIATGDFDIVIIGHSQLEKIPISIERQERFIQNQLDNIINGIEELKRTGGERFQIKQMEKTKRNLETRLKKMTESVKRDDIVTFEELGVDRLYVDEAHMFKNLYYFTKMHNVAGVPQTEAQKSADMLMKCQYMDEITGGRGIVFATATPVSNSMVEVYTMMKYLQNDMLNRMGWQHFDSWAANFGETVTSIELAPEGTGYRAKTRFAKFSNLPELMSVFKECADIKTADVLNLPTPEAHFHNVVAEPTDIQRNMVNSLSVRAQKVHNKEVDPKTDNMLCITNDGRKIGLDQRLMNPLLPDEPGTKVNQCVENVFNIWTETADKRSTQLIFCDFSTPKGKGEFNLYDDIKDKLTARGIPKEEIAFIHDAKSDAQKKELYAKMNKGSVRILIGSTSKCGTGMNAQNKLIALHDLDAPWRPADLQQRMGRIVRQGNENPEVDIYRYVTNATFDAYLWQTLENKQRFISQIMTSRSPVRSCEDADESTLSYAEVKALCAGDARIKEKMDLDIEVSKLKLLKADHANQQYELQDNVYRDFPEKIKKMEERATGYEKDFTFLNAQQITEFSPMTLLNKVYDDKEAAGKALLDVCKSFKGKKKEIGEYRGFKMSAEFDDFSHQFKLTLKREMSYTINLGQDVFGNITRINNALGSTEASMNNAKAQLEGLRAQLETAKSELGKPFPQEDELKQKSERLAELNVQLNLDNADAPQSEEKSVPDAAEIPKARDMTENSKEQMQDTNEAPRRSVRDKLKHNKALIAQQSNNPPKDREKVI